MQNLTRKNMRTTPQKQAADGAFAGTVDEQLLTVDYWHERFKRAFKQWESFSVMADELGENDTAFAKAAGVLLLQQIQVGRVARKNLTLMARAVQLMEKLRPVPTQTELATVLRRQGLVAPEN
jgi:hypothetical protein